MGYSILCSILESLNIMHSINTKNHKNIKQYASNVRTYTQVKWPSLSTGHVCLYPVSVWSFCVPLTVSTQHTHKYTSQVPTTKVALEQVRLFYVTCQPYCGQPKCPPQKFICLYMCVRFKITNAFDRSDRTYFKNVTIMHHL